MATNAPTTPSRVLHCATLELVRDQPGPLFE
jgi:hypothetical protein